MTFTRGKGQAIILAQEACQNYQVIVAVGGDGTINEVVNGLILAGKESILGVIPMGRANDFAYGVGIFNLKDAREALLGGKTKGIDVGEVNGRYFVNIFGVGFDARVMEEVRRHRRIFPLELGYLGYSLAILKYALFPPSLSIFMEGEGKGGNITWKQEGRFVMVAAANGPRCGKIIHIAPKAELDDGLLNICTVNELTPLRCFTALRNFIAGTPESLGEVKVFKSQKFIIRTPQETVAQVDGEILPPANFFQIVLHSRRITLLVPS